MNVQAGARASNGGGSYQGDVMFNLPVIKDKLAVRVVGWQRRVDGFVTNTGLGKEHTDRENTYGGRAEVLFQATDTTKLTGTFHFQSTKLDDSSRVFADGNYRTNPVLEPFADKMWIGNLTAEQDLGFGTLTATGTHIVRRSLLTIDQSQFLPGDPANLAVFLPARFASYDLSYGTIERHAKVVDNIAELRFASKFDLPVQVTTGLFYDRTRGRSIIYGLYIDPGTGLGYGAIPPWYETDSLTIQKNKAAFFNASWDITDKLSVEGGIRYYRLTQSNDTYIANPFFGTDVGYQPHDSSKQSGTVKKGQITYKPSDRILTYLVYSQGFRQGGANSQLPGTTGIPQSYGPDFVTNYEFGFKSELAGRQIVLNGALYHMDWKDVQVLQYDISGAYTFTTNGGKAGFNGIELETRIIPDALPGFSATMTARYSEQKLSEDNPAVTSYAGRKGQQIPYSNKVGFSAALDQKFTLADLPAFVHGDASYTGGGHTAFDPTDPTYRKIGNYAIFNARVGIEDTAWHAAIYAKNLTNERGFISWRVETLPGIADRVNVTPPREVGIEFGYNF